ncbi:MAG: ribose 5-phosphate isomerase B [Coriobacteriia bacterium]|nr:ribose 5-phosphate isomerase B [Coriobacteriia bacterium]
MRLRIGADHGGYTLKERIREHLLAAGHEVADAGTHGEEPVDYPAIALEVGRAVAAGDADRGILVCGTGIGMSIVANKVDGVRAANVTSIEFARLAREHNDANVLTLSGRFTDEATALAIVDAFLDAPFRGGRHGRRVAGITDAEKRGA